MKNSRLFSHSHFTPVIFALCAVLSLGTTLFAQNDTDNASSLADAPAHFAKQVEVMVEMQAAPAAATYAAGYKAAQAQADAARNYALQHPNLRSSQAALQNKTVQVSSTVINQANNAAKANDTAQQALLPKLTGGEISGKVLYRVQRAYNGIAMLVDPKNISKIAAMPGVKAVHPMHPKFLTTTFSDIDFLNTRPAWTTGAFGTHGEQIKVADIDTGLDYIHRNFGGTGDPNDYATVHDTTPPPIPGLFPTAKVPGGIDLAGDSYNADPNSPSYQPIPHPDNNPLDCGGHGTATASLIAGYGLTSSGFTYTGSYDASNPVMSNMLIPPGFAPAAKLYPVRVFGCAGSTDVVTQAIEWAMTTGTGNFANKVDVINMSLGANEGFADDADDVAASNAASIGIIVCSAAGNAGDSYYIHSSPAAASGTLSVAASYNDQNGFISDAVVTGNQPPSFAGQQGFSIYTTTSPHTSATGNVVYAVNPPGPTGSTHDGSSPLTNAAQVNGNICLVDRVPGQGSNASINCQNAGAIGIIDIADNNAGGDPFFLTTNPALTRPMVVCPTAYGTAMKAAANFDANGVSQSSPPLNVTIAPGYNVTTHPTNPPGTTAKAGSPDTLPSYTSRGPGMPDSRLKPDLTAPAEVTAVAQSAADLTPVPPLAGQGLENFNGTSSATPHVSGMMALLKQLHPTWSVQELNALACCTAVHDLSTTVGGSTLIGTGRIGAGRIDVGKAAAATTVAYNGTDPNLIGVSFGVVETPVESSRTVTKNITVTNKGATNITYNLTIQNDPAVTGATYSFPGGSSITVNAGTTTSVPVQLTVTGNALKHVREASVSNAQSGLGRQWLTEAGGYAVLTPTDSSPTLRVALWANPKPSSSMHATTTGVVPNTPNTGSFTINLSGQGVNTGPSLGLGTDILSLVKPFELQYVSANNGSPDNIDRNGVKYIGVTSDYPNYASGAQKSLTRVVFGIEHFGDSPEPDAFGGRDTEILFDTNLDGIPDFQVFLSRAGTGAENVYVPTLVIFDGTPAMNVVGVSTLTSVRTNDLGAEVADTNAFNNSAVTVPLKAFNHLGLIGSGGTGNTAFVYEVVTFDRNNNLIDDSGPLFYDLANPGLEVTNGGNTPGFAKVPTAGNFVEPFYFQDLSSNSIPVHYNGTNASNDGTLGVLLLHMHNGDGQRADVVKFLAPTITGFSPTHARVGDFVTITGSNFGPGTQVVFSVNTPASVVNVLTPNTLSVQVPAGAVSGPIRVQNAAGSAIKGGFTVDP